jgi:hypothetical protein
MGHKYGGLKGGGGIIYNMQGRYCKKMLRLPPSTVNGTAKYELGMESRRWQIVCRISELWCRILQVEQKLSKCYVWQIVNLKWENWVASLTLCQSNLNPYCLGWKAAFFPALSNRLTFQL